MSEEYLEVCTADGRGTGVKKLRKEIHRDGDWHRVVHVWLVNSRGELLIQKRSLKKESYPGLWDISAAGHVSWGETFMEAAVKELAEELGVTLPRETIQSSHFHTHATQSVLNGGSFINNEFVEVFLVQIPDWPVSHYVLQQEEVDQVRYIHWRELRRALDEGSKEFVACNTNDAYYTAFFKRLEDVERAR